MTACPTPDKIRYATREAAERAALRLVEVLNPYRCGCGWWHNTSQRPPKNPRVRPGRVRR